MGELLTAKRTPWGESGNHREIVLNMDALLKRYGIVNADQRARMTAHAIFASGWAQKVWHYNAWGVKRGSWPDGYYQMNTQEADAAGNYYSVPGEQWRAFTDWRQSISDFLNRISPTSSSAGYRAAAGHLTAPGVEHDSEYWTALGHGGYYTDKAFGGADFASLVRRVRSELAGASPDELAAAQTFALANIDGGSGAGPSKGWWGLGLLALVSGLVGWWLTREG